MKVALHAPDVHLGRSREGVGGVPVPAGPQRLADVQKAQLDEGRAGIFDPGLDQPRLGGGCPPPPGEYLETD